MSKHFIKEIEIKNFKCFKDFKAEDFGRVNLIGGKNNVGKTAFMEACYINVSSTNIKKMTFSLSVIKYMRENLNVLSGTLRDIKKDIELLNNIYTKSNINLSFFNIDDIGGVKIYNFLSNKSSITVNINDFSYETEYTNNINFIDNFGLGNREIQLLYTSIQEDKKEYVLDEILNDFDRKINSFKIINNIAKCEINNEFIEITELGDGVRHVISIIISIYACKDGYLFVDEIDNGIHYTKLDEILNLILKLSKQLNVQVFATTHSKECIESYARITKELENKDITFISLYKNKQDEIKSLTLNYETIQSRIELGLDNR